MTLSNSATIRPAEPGDLDAIEVLLTDSGLPTAGISGLLADHAADFFVAE